MPTYLHAIGSTFETLTPLDDLPIPIPTPKSEFFDCAVVETAVSGVDVPQGDAYGIWHFTFLTRKQRYQFRQFCPGWSEQVYVTLKTNEEASDGEPIYKTYLAIMHWPVKEDQSSKITSGFALTFTDLEYIAP